MAPIYDLSMSKSSSGSHNYLTLKIRLCFYFRNDEDVYLETTRMHRCFIKLIDTFFNNSSTINHSFSDKKE